MHKRRWHPSGHGSTQCPRWQLMTPSTDAGKRMCAQVSIEQLYIVSQRPKFSQVALGHFEVNRRLWRAKNKKKNTTTTGNLVIYELIHTPALRSAQPSAPRTACPSEMQVLRERPTQILKYMYKMFCFDGVKHLHLNVLKNCFCFFTSFWIMGNAIQQLKWILSSWKGPQF